MTYVGVDCGTSGLKAVVVDQDQSIAATSTHTYSPENPKPGWSEQNPDVWVGAMTSAFADLAKSAPDAWRKVAGIGLSGQMHGAVLLDRSDRPLRAAILHNDGRAHAEALELAERRPELAGIVGVKPMAGFVGPKMLWLARHEPATLEALNCILLPKDYLRLHLTGGRATDMSDAAGSWWLDEAARRWCEPAVRACGVDASHLPQLLEGSASAGHLRPQLADQLGLARNVVVAAGGGDASLGAIGLGAVRSGDAFISLGTACQLVLAANSYRAAPEVMLHSFAHALPGRWYRMAAMLNGASVLATFAKLFGRPVDALERLAAESYRGPGEVMFLPYLTGERTPHDDAHARGVLFGLSPRTSDADVVRAVMEGVAFSLADAKLCIETAGDALGSVGLVGGGSRSDLWASMIAAALDRPIVRSRGGEIGPAFGAARLARLATIGEDFEAVCTPPETASVVEPDPRLVDAFRFRIERFRSLYRALKPEFAAAVKN